MFRTIRKACFWLFAIVMVLAIAAGGAAWYYWSNADRILHETVTARLTEWSPHLRFQLGRCRLDWLGRIHVEQFSLTLPESERPLVDLPDTIVDLDRDALINRQELSVLSLRFLQPQIEATRYPDGTWDFQKLPPFPKSDRRSSLPDCELENAQLIIHVVREHGAEPATMIADNANLKLTPEGKRNLHIEGQARLEHVGQLDIEGRINVDTKTGSLTGKLADVRLGSDLLQYASTFEPSVTEKVAAVERRLLE